MTIKELVLSQNPQTINQWIALINKLGYNEHESLILNCADYYDKIIINYSAEFINTIN